MVLKNHDMAGWTQYSLATIQCTMRFVASATKDGSIGPT